LGKDVVFAAVKFSHLGSPLAVVDFSLSNFQGSSAPSVDVVEVSPSVEGVRLFEVSVDCDVLTASLPDEFDVVDGEPKSI
jgi:hypothetical protein